MSELHSRKIAVLAGGTSCEREISLISGRAVFEALRACGLSVILMDPADDFISALKREGVSLVFLALHGTFGEDGTVQKMLERAGIEYTGSGPLASELAFDKARTQALFKKSGIRVPDFLILKKGESLAGKKFPSFPWAVKPSRSGSSVGISLVFEKERFEEACEEAFPYSDTLLVDQYIPGRELTVGILGDRPLPIVEVIAHRKFYDYEAKYKDSETRYEFPAKLGRDEAKIVSETALRAYRALGCEVMGRVDIILGKNSLPYVLEVNTIPGLTNKSLLPKAAMAEGIDFPALCVRILDLSLKRPGSVGLVANEEERKIWQSP